VRILRRRRRRRRRRKTEKIGEISFDLKEEKKLGWNWDSENNIRTNVELK